jgi:glycosyltransferase involved in cell wall biosynthesis
MFGREVSLIKHLDPGLEIYFAATYPPRNCGIATFTYDLAHAVAAEIGNHGFHIVAMNNPIQDRGYPEEVAFEIAQNQINDYRLAADYINVSREGVVSLQHEFGIFGGPEGTYINHFLGNLKRPIVTTLHTVLKEPDEGYRKALSDVAELSHALVVMGHQSETILREIYHVPEHKIRFIHHGVPDVAFIDPNFHKDRFNVEGRTVLLTFGLLNPNKGIETVIEALATVVKRFPKVAYIILGATHPEVKKQHGEAYRLSVERMVSRLGLEQNVFFHNRFVSLEELCQFIGATDIYITPYLSKEQSTSGPLAYALSMGKAVISTPYTYAEEMLGGGRGKLVEFGDPADMARTIIGLIENEADRHRMRKKAYEMGRQMTWKNVARQYLSVFHEVLGSFHARPETEIIQTSFMPQGAIPEIKLDHLFRLSDETGIIQHSVYGIPDRNFGYSTDDVARALVVTLGAYHRVKEERFLTLANAYIAFLRHAQLADGRFRNFMDYSRQFDEGPQTEDTWGMAIWGLGCGVHLGPTEWFRILSKELLERATVNLDMEHPMAKAYAMIGLYHFLQRYGSATAVKKVFQNLADSLIERYGQAKKDEWCWFSDSVTYGNTKMPQALLLAYKVLNNEIYETVALESLDFLTHLTYTGEHFDFVGNVDWYKKGKEKSLFDQQPVDAGYAVETYLLAYEITKEPRYLELGQAAFDWFFGRNCLGVSLYDFAQGACYDGLTPYGPNLNQGAESTIAFLLGNLAMFQQGFLTSAATSGDMNRPWYQDIQPLASREVA